MGLPRTTHLPKQAEKGFSLIELMVALTIGLILMGGLTTLLVQQSSSQQELEKSSRQIENGRYAISVIAENIQHAGYYGLYNAVPAPSQSGYPALLPNPCATDAATLKDALPLHIQGYDSPTSIPSPLSDCLANANHVSGTDILVIRRADTNVTSTANLSSGTIYIQSTPSDAPIIADGSSAGNFTLTKKDTVTLADIRKLVVHIYFISPCTIPAGGGSNCTGSSDDQGKPVPALKRLELGAGEWNIVSIAQGIDTLQLDYGLDTISHGAPATNVTAPALADWGNVMAVRINLLARNYLSSTGYTDTKIYSMGGEGNIGPFNDTYKRHAFSELVRAINPSSRREI